MTDGDVDVGGRRRQVRPQHGVDGIVSASAAPLFNILSRLKGSLSDA